MTDGELLDTLLAVRRMERLGILLDDIPTEELIDTFRADNIMDMTYIQRISVRRSARTKALKIISQRKFGVTMREFAKRFLITEECKCISKVPDIRIAQSILNELREKGLVIKIINRYIMTRD